MTQTTAVVDPRMIAFMLPNIPESARIARFHVKAALSYHRLEQYADDAGIITSELVTNAIQHACEHPHETIGVTLARVWHPAVVAVVVSDPSSEGPIVRDTTGSGVRGRGLHIVEELSAHWGWHLEDGGKAVFAILASESA